MFPADLSCFFSVLGKAIIVCVCMSSLCISQCSQADAQDLMVGRGKQGKVGAASGLSGDKKKEVE